MENTKHSFSELLYKRHKVVGLSADEIFYKRTGRRLSHSKPKYPRITKKRILQPWDEKFIDEFIREVACE